MVRRILRDDQWNRIEAILPSKEGNRSRSGKNNRVFVERWIARTGVPWRDLPEAFGAWNSVYPTLCTLVEQRGLTPCVAELAQDEEFEEGRDVTTSGCILLVHAVCLTSCGR